MSTKQIADHFSEAFEILQKFNNPSNHSFIKTAGETMVTSGTSMAVPHVVGAASLLWQKDTSKSKDFIKDLLEESARNLGDKESYGNGLIDYEYAEKQYTKAEEQYEQGQDIELKDNTKTIKTYNNSSDENKVSGTWSAK